jgi:hypothetical protein
MTEAVPTLIDETNHVVTLKPVVTLQNDPTADLVDVPVDQLQNAPTAKLVVDDNSWDDDISPEIPDTQMADHFVVLNGSSRLKRAAS